MMMPGTCWNLGEGEAPRGCPEPEAETRTPDAREGREGPSPGSRRAGAPGSGARPRRAERAACRESPSSSRPPAHSSGSGCPSPT